MSKGRGVAGEIGDAAAYCHLDVTSSADWDRAVAFARETFGELHVLVNNAGIAPDGVPLQETPEALFTRVLDVNVRGVFLGMQAVAPHMREARSGSIVNISSVAGLEGNASSFAYSASKWAVRGMTRCAAQELGRFGVRVNSIHPGFIETDMMQQTPAVTSGKLDTVLRTVPLKRSGSAGEVANLALFLASDESAYCTGSEFVVDGGLHR